MNTSKEWSWFRVLIEVEQNNDDLFLNTVKMNPTKKCMCEWGEDEVIRNDNEVKKGRAGDPCPVSTLSPAEDS